MRGKKPKERDSYVLRMEDGTLVEVSREVYLEWYQSQRRERYQKEKSRKHGIYSLDALEKSRDCRKMPFCILNHLADAYGLAEGDSADRKRVFFHTDSF